MGVLLWLKQWPRWFVGLVLLATGIGKALDMPGFAGVIAGYELLPAWAEILLAYTLPFLELAAGFCLLSGYKLRKAAWFAVGLHAVLLVTVFITLWRGIAVANCGCFGVFWARPLTPQTAVEDAVMLGVSLLILRVNPIKAR